MGYIDAARVEAIAARLDKSGYGEYLRRMLKDELVRVSRARRAQPAGADVSADFPAPASSLRVNAK